nr:phosphatidylinositol-3,5-bisphosphate 5-phosphatase [Polyrhizophydium stewartii]
MASPVKLEDLPVHQLQAVRQQIEEEIQSLTQSFGKLKQAQSKFSDCVESLKPLTSANSGKTIMSIADATDFYKRKVDFLRSNLEKLQETVTQRQSQRGAVVDMIQLKLSMIRQESQASKAKFTLYETKTALTTSLLGGFVGMCPHQRMYMVGTDSSEEHFRIAKIDRTVADELSLVEDSVKYTKKEMEDLLGMIENGNKSTGGLRKVTRCFGIFGFIRFLEGYYIILITKRSAVALLGGHHVYHIDETVVLSVTSSQVKLEKKPDEARYLQTFGKVDINKNFYFSYSYDITSSLQRNLAESSGEMCDPTDMYIWNSFLVRDSIPANSVWRLNIIYGFVDQSRISVFGRSIFVTLIARRSRHYAGARFLKRGVNDQGFVANDVETEQIVHDASTTSFFSPPGRYGSYPGYTSFLQHRGSIPVFWINYIDPFFTPAARHFNDMFRRYGTPIMVLNLVKSKERTKRESILLEQFTDAIWYLNQFLPEARKIQYIAWDMARASKSAEQDVISILEDLADQVLETTGFFHSGAEPLANAERRVQ